MAHTGSMPFACSCSHLCSRSAREGKVNARWSIPYTLRRSLASGKAILSVLGSLISASRWLSSSQVRNAMESSSCTTWAPKTSPYQSIISLARAVLTTQWARYAGPVDWVIGMLLLTAWAGMCCHGVVLGAEVERCIVGAYGGRYRIAGLEVGGVAALHFHEQRPLLGVRQQSGNALNDCFGRMD